MNVHRVLVFFIQNIIWMFAIAGNRILILVFKGGGVIKDGRASPKASNFG